jgi:hypothetical protein
MYNYITSKVMESSRQNIDLLMSTSLVCTVLAILYHWSKSRQPSIIPSEADRVFLIQQLFLQASA